MPDPDPLTAAELAAIRERRHETCDLLINGIAVSLSYAMGRIGRMRKLHEHLDPWIASVRSDIDRLLAEVERLKAESIAQWEADHQRSALELHGLMDSYNGCDSIDRVCEQLVASRAEVERLQRLVDSFASQTAHAESVRHKLQEAIIKHAEQKADDRCWMDDQELYEAAHIMIADNRIGDPCAILENCKRFIKNRCEAGGPWKSYVEMEAEVAQLQEKIIELEVTLDDEEAANIERQVPPEFTCRVRAAGLTDPPQDCDWPMCGCDPRADKVIEALQESGCLVSRAEVERARSDDDLLAEAQSLRERAERAEAELVEAMTAGVERAARCKDLALTLRSILTLIDGNESQVPGPAYWEIGRIAREALGE